MSSKILKGRAELNVETLEVKDLGIPVYDGDVESSGGIPVGVQSFVQSLRDADGILISTPEYNGSIPGPLKNLIDWASRPQPNAWSRKKIFLLAASPGSLGGIRGLWHSRVPLEALGAHVFPEMFALPHASDAMDENHTLKDGKNQERLQKLLNEFVAFCGTQK